MPFKTNPKTGFCDQGYYPGGLVEGSDGFLYGVNSDGGPNPASSGTVFKVSKTGTGFQLLQTFCTMLLRESGTPTRPAGAVRRQACLEMW